MYWRKFSPSIINSRFFQNTARELEYVRALTDLGMLHLILFAKILCDGCRTQEQDHFPDVENWNQEIQAPGDRKKSPGCLHKDET